MKLAIALTTTILSLSTLDARATAPADVDGITVSYADLDLDRNAGIVTLYRRIQGAARSVCDVHSGRMLVTKRSYSSCVANAVGSAVVQIDRPMLSEYVARQSGKTLAPAPSRVAVR